MHKGVNTPGMACPCILAASIAQKVRFFLLSPNGRSTPYGLVQRVGALTCRGVGVDFGVGALELRHHALQLTQYFALHACLSTLKSRVRTYVCVHACVSIHP